ncbi:hypothetical protein KC332_g9806 [Hortaea werneckii]|uniref:SH3 domain-containing protein n=2 Tax=Hortaea werneckii TaxID=91943 RepID=A0A3M7IJU5_HORWE|nr:hypothetical protein KC358_g9674 [Hortaea werneckii]OTA37876.1 hypothetical protein BTJ68_02420 [Hortaea werneckii EXF-2000]KAI6824717.1 hypothetical protein KC350_g8957 [Hortaea werneckii]KAI6944587.1 hypothetical protein KC341_g716 [Hortaea werneckii]KAI6950192.1 hypothetical protein KC348_g813 [Hortaea werneckii]
MATLNTSTNGQNISASYQKVVNAPPASGAAANSPTYGQWALFSVQAPLVSAFQAEGGKESVLKVQSTGEGELAELMEDFSDGRIQFGFVKVKDQNTGLPKNVLIAWCGEGVPERTKGYFTSHLNAVTKILHGYHVQVTARSEGDLSPEGIVQKVADSSGSKYGGSGGQPTVSPAAGGPPPPVASKPAMPTKSFGASAFQPLSQRSRQAPAQPQQTDEDGWGEDAPPVTRTQLEKVESSYKPTKVDMGQLQSQKEPSRYQPPQRESNDSDVVKGGYQPVGKVDIGAIRKEAQEKGDLKDDRPTAVKGSYEPVGKVDIGEIRRKAQGASSPAQPSPPPPAPAQEDEDRPKSLAERTAAFTSAASGGGDGRLTSMPKPQVSNRFGSQTSSFTGTKAPTPGGFANKPTPAASAPIGAASKNFADAGGKTPAQQWEERRRARGLSGAGDAPSPGAGAAASPVQSQPSGGWQSGYGGKKWDVQIPTRTGGSGVSGQKTGENEPAVPEQSTPEPEPESEPPTGNVGSIRDRFKDAAPMGAQQPGAATAGGASEPPAPPPLDTVSKPNAGAKGMPIPGMAPPAPQEEPEPEPESQAPAEEHQRMPPPPPRPMPNDSDEEEDDDYQPRGSPAQIAMPVSRNAQDQPEQQPSPEVEKAEPLPPRAMPTASLEEAIASRREPEPEPQVEEEDPARGAGQQAAAASFGHTEDARGTSPPPSGAAGGKEAIAQYDYEKAEDNELELRDGERITDIEMVDEDWWMGRNERGESGLFPANYVELVQGGGDGNASAAAPPPPAPAPASPSPPPQPAAAPAQDSKTATAQYDYDAAEDNELSFPDGAKITDIEFPDEDWWFGHYGGKSGLFPANYVELDR